MVETGGWFFKDFQALGMEKWVEMDTVHSSKESVIVLLTFFFKKENSYGALKKSFEFLTQ